MYQGPPKPPLNLIIDQKDSENGVTLMVYKFFFFFTVNESKLKLAKRKGI